MRLFWARELVLQMTHMTNPRTLTWRASLQGKANFGISEALTQGPVYVCLDALQRRTYSLLYCGSSGWTSMGLTDLYGTISSNAPNMHGGSSEWGFNLIRGAK